MAAFTMTDKPKRHPDVRYSIVPEGALVVHHRKGELKTLNPVGGLILDLSDGSRTVGEIVDRIAEEYHVGRSEAEQDALTFLDELTRHEVVTLG